MRRQPTQSLFWLTRYIFVLMIMNHFVSLSALPPIGDWDSAKAKRDSESPAEFRPEIGVRALSMGGAFVSEADATSVFWNPAGLARLKRGNLSYDLSQGVMGLSYPISGLGTLGFFIVDLNSRDRFLFDHPKNPIGTLETGSNQILFSVGRSVGNRWLLGGNLGMNRPEIKGMWAMNLDLGAIYLLSPTLSVGASLLDLTGTELKSGEGMMTRHFAQQVRFGTGWQIHPYLKLNADYDITKRQLRLGTEVERYGVALRMGVITAIDNQPSTWTGGFSISRFHTKLHYAYLQDPNRFRRHLLAVGLTFGGHEGPTALAHKGVLFREELPPLLAEHKPLRALITKGKQGIQLKNGVSQSGLPSQQNFRPEFPKPATQLPLPLNPVPALEEETFLRPSADSESPGEQLARQYNVELAMLLALIRAESNFDPMAVSQTGAVGLTQLMPDTARSLGLKVPRYKDVKEPLNNPHEDERFHPRKNLLAGLAYLRALLDAYSENYVLAISAYHAGQGRVIDEVPAIRQTEKHIGRVFNSYYQYKNSPQRRAAALQQLDRALEK